MSKSNRATKVSQRVELKAETTPTEIQALAETVIKAESVAREPEPIELRLEGNYIVARCGDSFGVFRLFSEAPYGEDNPALVLRPCDRIPHQFEAEAYGPRLSRGSRRA